MKLREGTSSPVENRVGAPHRSDAGARSDNFLAYRWIVLLLATLVQVGVSMLQQAPSALGPLLTTGLDLSRAQLGLLSSAIIGGMTLTTLLMGVLIDRRGERGVVVAGVTTMVLLVFLAAQVSTFGWLFALFLLASFGAASSTPGGSKGITSWFPGSQRGMAMGVRQTGIPVGGLLAALLLPPIATQFGWAVGLEVAAGITLLVVLCFAIFYREPRDEETASAPRVPIGEIIRNRSFLAATGYSFVLVGAQWSATAYLTLFLHEKAEISVVLAGALLAVLQVGGVAGRIGWGMVSDRLGRRKPAMIFVSLVAVVCCLTMVLVGPSTPLPLLILFAVVLGLSLLGWNGLYVTIVAESTSIRAAATAVGAGLTVTNLGSFAVPPLFGLLIDLSSSYSVFWLALGGWVSLGAVLGSLIREPHRKEDS